MIDGSGQTAIQLSIYIKRCSFNLLHCSKANCQLPTINCQLYLQLRMNELSNPPNKYFWLLFGLTAFIIWFRLGATPIYILDEAKNAQCAREMLLRHNWIVPTFNGELRADKPVLHYWFMMTAYKILGVHEWTARLFATFMGLATIFFTWFFTKKWFDRPTAFFAAVFLCCSTQFLFEFRLSVPDPFLIFFTTLGLFSMYSYITTLKWKWIITAGIALGFAALAKGPVALALPGLISLCFMFFQKKWKALFNIKIIVAAILFLSVTAPWYISVHVATAGAWTKGFFFEHNLNRFSSTMEGHGGPFIITPFIVFIGLLPGSIFVFPSLKRKYLLWQQPFTQFAAIVALVYIVFFSISKTKLPNYPMPCYPFIAIIIANWTAKFSSERKPIPLYAIITLLIIGVLLPIIGYFALNQEVATHNLAPLALWIIILPFGLLIILFTRKKIFPKILLSIVFLYLLFNFLFIDVLYPIIYNKNPVTLSMPLIDTNMKVVAFQDYNPAFNFYLPSNVQIVNNIDSLGILLKKQNLAILTREDRIPYFDTATFKINIIAHDIFENPTSVVIYLKK